MKGDYYFNHQNQSTSFLPLINKIRMVSIVIGLFPIIGFCDSYYTAVKISCDSELDTLNIINISAYNEHGIKNTDESQGIYTPDRIWHKQNSSNLPRKYRCKTRSADFTVKIAPVFGKISDGDGLEVAVIRNGENVLHYTPLDRDYFGIYPGSYIISIVIPSFDKPIFKTSCQVKVHLGIKCKKK